MAGSKKKKSSTLILLLIAMIAMIGACFWLIKHNEQKANVDSEEATTDETTSIASLDTDTLASISFSNESGEMTLVVDDEGVWKNAADELFPVNQTNAGYMQSAFADVSSSRTITEVENLSEYGLDAPTIQVTATLDDGTETIIAIGDEAPISGGYYATVNGGSEVYVVTSAFRSYFAYSSEDMMMVETIPSITAEYITHLTIENKDKSNFEISYDAANGADYAGFTNWTMKQPYATEIPADADAVTTLLANYTAMAFISCVDYNATDLSKYGLDDPSSTVALEYYEVYTKETEDTTDTTEVTTADTTEAETTTLNYQYELLIGGMDEDGNYYAKSSDSNAVNTISADTVATLTNVDAYSNAYHYINLINIEAIDKIDIDIEGVVYTMSLEEVAQTVEEAQTMEETTVENTTESSESVETEVTNYYFNNTLVDETEFKELYQSVIAPTTKRDIPAEYFDSNASQDPYLTLTFHFLDGTSATIQYIPYDDSYYVVNADGVEYFLTDLRDINTLAETVAAFQK